MSRWPTGFAAASLVFSAWTLSDFAGPAFREGLGASVLLGVVFLAALASGGVLTALLRLPGLGRGEGVLIAATLGLGVLSLSVFGLGILGQLRALPVALMLGFFCLAGFSRLREAASVLRQALPAAGRHPLAAAGLCAVLGLLFWTAWVPPHQYDSLVYHLALPEAYARAGRIVVVDHLLFSHFPQNGEMLFTLALLMGSDLLAQMIVWACTVLSVGWILSAGARFLPLPAALLGGGLLSTHTAVMLLSGTTYVEPIVMLWGSAAVLSFMRWRQESAERPSRGWLLLSAVFCGLALGSKYYAGITAGLLASFLLLRLAVAEKRRREAADLAVFCGVTTLVFSPWLVKNFVEVGNPVFPFFYRHFADASFGWEGQAAKDYFQILTEYGHGGNVWRALADLPFMLLGNSLRFGGGMDVLGNFGWELSFLCLPLALWAGRSSWLARGLLLYFFCYLGVWFSTGVILRFLVATAPLLCLLAAFGLHAFWKNLKGPARICLSAAASLLTAVHFLVFGFAHQVFGSGAVLWGLEDREAFLSRRLDYYPCARWSAGHLGKNDKILIVGEQRGYYVGRAHSATTVNAPNRFLQWASQEPTASAFAGRLREEGFSHLMVVPREAGRLKSLMRPFSERAWSNGEDLDLETVFQGPFCRVYSLSGAGAF